MAINVRINQPAPVRIQGTTTFVGSISLQSQLDEIRSVANSAIMIAQGAYDTANTKYDQTGGHIMGNVIVDNNLTVANTIYADMETIDAGTF